MSAELLSPAGDFETALAAFAAGADAVYFGLAEFSARAFAKDFSIGELNNLVAYARANGRKAYVTFNTVVDEDRFATATEALARLEESGPDAVIVQDLGVARTVRRHFPRLELHASTPLVAHNLEGVLALKEMGFRRVVLARELSLCEIREIAKRCGAMKIASDGRPELELEVFIHGALCYSISGLCLFGAMEAGRSGNRGSCPYCCRQGFPLGNNGSISGSHGSTFHPFAMKDLRLGDDVRMLADAGVASLKIEGRMKSPLYVASVTRYYRQILDAAAPGCRIGVSDLETVFSRHTTRLYFDGKGDSPLDSGAQGHVGTPIGTVKKITRDREGRAWLRFHTSRTIEKHDGLQFDAVDARGRRLGTGVSEMRLAMSRQPVFEAAAGSDVEVMICDGAIVDALRPGMRIYCSMSNAVKRMFPPCAFRPSEYEGVAPVDVEVKIAADGLYVRGYDARGPETVACAAKVTLTEAKRPEMTEGAVRKAFSRFGGTGYRLGRLSVVDRERLFPPMSAMNALRRDLVELLDAAKERRISAKIAAAAASDNVRPLSGGTVPVSTVKLRPGQRLPSGEWGEIVVAVSEKTLAGADVPFVAETGNVPLRLALPVYTPDADFNRLRVAVKRAVRAGFLRWECSDLATLRMLRGLGLDDITADWTLYAFNTRALAGLAESGVRRFVASPENSRANLARLAASGYAVEFLAQQSTPLFVSLTKPALEGAEPMHVAGLSVFRKDGLWVTVRDAPRTFEVPDGAPVRTDLSWDPA